MSLVAAISASDGKRDCEHPSGKRRSAEPDARFAAARSTPTSKALCSTRWVRMATWPVWIPARQDSLAKAPPL